MSADFAGARVLITGGLGFIGSNLARRLVGCGAEVTIVDSLFPDYGGSMFNLDGIAERVRVNISDVRNGPAMQHLVRGQDFLFNLAGQTSHLDSMLNPTADLEINCAAQLAILETCRSVNPEIRIVFASTRQIYGKPEQLPVPETHPLNPVDVNGINKIAGEMYHLLYSRVHGIRATSLRLTNTIGPRMRIKDARQTFVGVWIRNLLRGEPIEVWGGTQRRDLTDVNDAVEAFLLAARDRRAEGQVYNVGGSEVIDLKSLAQLMIEVNGGGQMLEREFPAERRAIDIGDYYADDTKLREQLGWSPQRSLRETIERTLAFYREHLAEYT